VVQRAIGRQGGDHRIDLGLVPVPDEAAPRQRSTTGPAPAGGFRNQSTNVRRGSLAETTTGAVISVPSPRRPPAPCCPRIGCRPPAIQCGGRRPPLRTQRRDRHRELPAPAGPVARPEPHDGSRTSARRGRCPAARGRAPTRRDRRRRRWRPSPRA
jgi:hypothetical protein